MHADARCERKEKEQAILNWGKPRGVTTDTTNKGPRPRGPAEARREERVIIRVFSFDVHLLDTTNKRWWLRRNQTGRSESHTLIHISNIQERKVGVVGMVMTPFRTQTINSVHE